MTKEKIINLLRICLMVYCAIRVLDIFTGYIFSAINGYFSFSWRIFLSLFFVLGYIALIVVYLLIQKGKQQIEILSFVPLGIILLGDVISDIGNIITLIGNRDYYETGSFVKTLITDILSDMIWFVGEAAIWFVLCVLLPKLLFDVLNGQAGSAQGYADYGQASEQNYAAYAQTPGQAYEQTPDVGYTVPLNSNDAPAGAGQQGGYEAY